MLSSIRSYIPQRITAQIQRSIIANSTAFPACSALQIQINIALSIAFIFICTTEAKVDFTIIIGLHVTTDITRTFENRSLIIINTIQMLNTDADINNAALVSQSQILAAVTHCGCQTGSPLCKVTYINYTTIMSIQQIACCSFQAALVSFQTNFTILASFNNIAVCLQHYASIAISSRFQNNFAGIICIIACISTVALLVAFSSNRHLSILKVNQALLVVINAINFVCILTLCFDGYLTVPCART